MGDFPGYDRDRDRLQAFFQDTYGFVGNLYQEGTDAQGNPIFPGELAPLMRQAWAEFEQDFDMEDAVRQINELPDEKMVAYGLHGAQLEMKLTVIDRLRGAWNIPGGDKILKKLIDAMDTLLDCLLAATGINEALKELKDILSGLLD